MRGSIARDELVDVDVAVTGGQLIGLSDGGGRKAGRRTRTCLVRKRVPPCNAAATPASRAAAPSGSSLRGPQQARQSPSAPSGRRSSTETTRAGRRTLEPNPPLLPPDDPVAALLESSGLRTLSALEHARHEAPALDERALGVLRAVSGRFALLPLVFALVLLKNARVQRRDKPRAPSRLGSDTAALLCVWAPL